MQEGRQSGEIIITEAARSASGLPVDGLEPRRLELKGRSTPVDVWVMRIGAEVTPASNPANAASV